jgi:hypothetical protein
VTRAPAGHGSRRDAHAHDDDRQRGSGRRRTLPRCVGRESRVDGCRAPRVPPARPHGAGRASGRAGAARAGRPRPWVVHPAFVVADGGGVDGSGGDEGDGDPPSSGRPRGPSRP